MGWGVYAPAEDTVLLARAAEKIVLAPAVCEVGCGSGLITVELAALADAVVATDVSRASARETWRRCREAGCGHKVHVVCCDRLEAFRAAPIFQAAVFNPPYLPVVDEDPSWSGGLTGVEAALSFLESIDPRLAPGGLVLCVSSTVSDWRRLIAEIMERGYAASVIRVEGVGLFEELVIVLGKKLKKEPTCGEP